MANGGNQLLMTLTQNSIIATQNKKLLEQEIDDSISCAALIDWH